MDLSDLAGRSFGPHPFHLSPHAVADFVEVTGDDPERWSYAAPPGFMAAPLFAVAPELLALLYEHSVIHGEQSFSWSRPLVVGDELSVAGVVTQARERGSVHFITFEVEVGDKDGLVASGSALFLAAGDSVPTAAAEERAEPAVTDRGDPADGQVSASRADLVHYAAVTRDWNPVHWDHEAAVSAGFPGVVVHGLLQAAWALRTAAAPTNGDRPLATARVRFRNPLFPATPVSIASDRSNSTVVVILTDSASEYISARIELADE